MTTAIISFRLHGGVRQIRSVESLSEGQKRRHINNVDAEMPYGRYKYLPESAKMSNVENEERLCIQRFKVSEELMESLKKNIIFPSRTMLRAKGHDVKYNKAKRRHQPSKSYTVLGVYAKLHMYAEDLLHDFGAKSFSVEYLK